MMVYEQLSLCIICQVSEHSDNSFCSTLIALANYAKHELSPDYHDAHTAVVAERFYSSCCWEHWLIQQRKQSQHCCCADFVVTES